MSVEKAILVAVLKLTRSGPIDYSLVSKAAGIPAQTVEAFLRDLADASLVSWKGSLLKASTDQRVEMATQAIRQGADFENVCRMLEWKEFESISTNAFESYDYNVKRNFRFKGPAGKRWEIDLVACKEPIVASVDCKDWKRNWTRGPVTRIVEEHIHRTKDLSDFLPSVFSRIGLENWTKATVIPVVLSLLPSSFKFYRGTPVVPVLRLQSFLNDLPVHVHSLTHFSKKLTAQDRKITEFQQ